jgi:hypothetical protein
MRTWDDLSRKEKWNVWLQGYWPRRWPLWQRLLAGTGWLLIFGWFLLPLMLLMSPYWLWLLVSGQWSAYREHLRQYQAEEDALTQWSQEQYVAAKDLLAWNAAQTARQAKSRIRVYPDVHRVDDA